MLKFHEYSIIQMDETNVLDINTPANCIWISYNWVRLESCSCLLPANSTGKYNQLWNTSNVTWTLASLKNNFLSSGKCTLSTKKLAYVKEFWELSYNNKMCWKLLTTKITITCFECIKDPSLNKLMEYTKHNLLLQKAFNSIYEYLQHYNECCKWKIHLHNNNCGVT